MSLSCVSYSDLKPIRNLRLSYNGNKPVSLGYMCGLNDVFELYRGKHERAKLYHIEDMKALVTNITNSLKLYGQSDIVRGLKMNGYEFVSMRNGKVEQSISVGQYNKHIKQLMKQTKTFIFAQYSNGVGNIAVYRRDNHLLDIFLDSESVNNKIATYRLLDDGEGLVADTRLSAIIMYGFGKLELNTNESIAFKIDSIN